MVSRFGGGRKRGSYPPLNRVCSLGMVGIYLLTPSFLRFAALRQPFNHFAFSRMTQQIRLTSLLLTLLVGTAAYGQTPAQTAETKGRAAIRLMDEGKLDESIALLQEARQLDPSRSAYRYELSYAYYQQKKYAQALELAEPLVQLPDASDRTFELLGNLYDNSGNATKAIETYEAGLHKFPKSGRLQLELGVVYMGAKNYDKAIGYFEDGIKVAPSFSSNYYWAARLLFNSTEKVWGMLYGEVFMNLERNSPRTAEISKLLYDTYQSQITFKGPDTTVVRFSSSTIQMPAKGQKLKLPYGSTIYEPILLVALGKERTLDAFSLDRIRTSFVQNYYRIPFSKDKPNVLFDYQQRLLQAGHLEAYNHWLLMMGNEAAFREWEKANPGKWQSFAAWFQANPLALNDSHRLYRQQFD
jgi:tetratricopeptide (TPR) repeat protein